MPPGNERNTPDSGFEQHCCGSWSGSRSRRNQQLGVHHAAVHQTGATQRAKRNGVVDLRVSDGESICAQVSYCASTVGRATATRIQHFAEVSPCRQSHHRRSCRQVRIDLDDGDM